MHRPWPAVPRAADHAAAASEVAEGGGGSRLVATGGVASIKSLTILRHPDSDRSDRTAGPRLRG